MKTGNTSHSMPDTVATDAVTCDLYEDVRNGVTVDWAYWCERAEITPHQAAKLFYCIDPILWPDDRIESGPIPNNLRIKLQRLEQRLAEVKARWTLADLAETLGATTVPLSMQYAVQTKRKQAAGRYTLEEAANEIDQHTGDRAGPMLEKLMQAVRDERLPVYEPGQTGRYQPKTVRGFYEEAYRCDLNKWLAENEPRIAWRFPDPQIGADSTAAKVSHGEAAKIQQTPQELRAIAADSARGAKREILEHWDAIATLHGPDANAAQVERYLKRQRDAADKSPSKKTIHNRLGDLRRDKLIP